MTAQMHAIDLPFELSKKGTATLRKLNERTAAHEKKRPEIEQRDEELRQLELRPGSASAFVEAARAATDARINFLLEEQQLRGDRDAFYEECESEMQAAVDKAYQEWESAQVEVRQGLIAMGYVDGVLPGTDHLSILPGYIMTHPRVFNARNKHESLRQYDLAAQRKVNAEAAKVVAMILKRTREKLLQTDIA